MGFLIKMEYRKLDQFYTNYGFRVQYNRLFKNEYLPGRVKYNTFFFIAVAGSLYAFQRSKLWGFVDESQTDLGERRYYCLPRRYTNPVTNGMDRSSLASHNASATFTL